MDNIANKYASVICSAATLVIKIHSVGGKRWKRDVAKGSRIGPWLQGQYEIINELAWRDKQPCLYLVQANDSRITYIGISRNGLKHRWRTSPAFDAETLEKLPVNQLFHSQCWKHIQAESDAAPGISYEVRVITADKLSRVLEQLGEPLSALCVLRDDEESLVASIERWLCNRSSAELASWNRAMTGKTGARTKTPIS
ncbi:hypothetical protein SAMN05216386_1687 [Nitrosospira briensis]|uniref:GIY-YIG domain-containing protein n=1 Tax=Nitrosospira briensis TaxID=35799 RepID=A0A1I5BIR2_9PROT|nr:hypothetical protein [Nitrosospira briensis]SFN74530.1 hypothetical protein SAMN05216386_1687 [Nitrosospira briensis]